MYTTIVSTDLLASHLEVRLTAATAGDWAIVDCRFDLQNEQWGRDQYRLAHIPGAVYASLNEDLSGPLDGTNGRHPLPAIDALAATLGRLGIDRSTQVVAYDQDTGSYASRLWWLLRYLGHDAVGRARRRVGEVGPRGHGRRAAETRRRQSTTFTPSPRAGTSASRLD